MDSVTLLVSALAVGAAAGMNETSTQVVNDTYEDLKRLVSSHGVDVAAFERQPESMTQRAALQETLTEVSANEHDELLMAARRLVDAVRRTAPAAASVVGIDLDDVEASFLRVERLRSDDAGIRIRRGRFSGGIDLSDITALAGSQNSP